MPYQRAAHSAQIQYFGTHTILGSSASEYLILHHKKVIVNQIPEKI